jgi:hypothetical protein
VRGSPVLNSHFSPGSAPQVGQRTARICFGLSSLKRVAFSLLTLAWLPLVVDEIVWHFEQTDTVVAFGVIWLVWVTVPATFVCAVPLAIMWLRSVKRKIDSIEPKESR